MSDSPHSEVDTRVILHVSSCVHSGLKYIYVWTNDTDVLVILVAYVPDFLDIDSNVLVSVISGVGFNTSCKSVNAIAAYVGLKSANHCWFCTIFQVVIIHQAFFTLEKWNFGMSG